MFIQIALVLSVILQFGAFFITISLIPKTKFNIAWVSISIGFLLMAFRRLSDIFFILGHDNSPYQLISSWIAIIISITMFVASFYIRKIFILLSRLNRLSKESEARVLRAVIATEEKERKFFAKELHDGLGPILSSMKMTLSAVDKAVVGVINREIITKTESAVDSAIMTTKEISNHLNPQVLERFGLEKAIRTFINNVTVSTYLNFEVTSNINKERCDYTIEVILYRILCELINNTLKHASAQNVVISILAEKESMACTYFDDGIGFDTSKQCDKGMGLVNIRSRVKSLNGQISIASEISKGVSIKLTFPL